MSRVIGSLSKASQEFNNINTKDTVKGIKLAARLSEQIQKASLDKEEESSHTLSENETHDELEL